MISIRYCNELFIPVFDLSASGYQQPEWAHSIFGFQCSLRTQTVILNIIFKLIIKHAIRVCVIYTTLTRLSIIKCQRK